MKKKILLMISLALLVVALAACAAQNASDTSVPTDTSADTSTDTPPASDGVFIIDKNGTEFVMVVPSGAANLFNACTEIKSETVGKYSKNLFVKYEGAENERQHEILVGQTGRAESNEVCQGLSSKEYRIVWVGDKLVIGGGTNYAAKGGVKWLLDNYFKTADENGAVIIPKDIDQKGSVNLNLEFQGLRTGWNSLVYPAGDGTEMPYQIYMPANYDPAKEYPCILYMHSAGVRCDDNSHINTGEAKFLRNFESGKYKDEAIIIAPCCPKSNYWVPTAGIWNKVSYDFINSTPTSYMNATTELFDLAREKLSIDDSRLYLYGMSMGGFATWYLLTKNPDTFAAAIPVAAAGDPNAVSLFDKTAIWMFHGTADTAVPYESATVMYNALVAAGRDDVKFTTFDGAGHGIWTMTANTEGLFDWLFSQKLAD